MIPASYFRFKKKLKNPNQNIQLQNLVIKCLNFFFLQQFSTEN